MLRPTALVTACNRTSCNIFLQVEVLGTAAHELRYSQLLDSKRQIQKRLQSSTSQTVFIHRPELLRPHA